MRNSVGQRWQAIQRLHLRNWDFLADIGHTMPETEWELPVVIRFVEFKPPVREYWQRIFTK